MRKFLFGVLAVLCVALTVSSCKKAKNEAKAEIVPENTISTDRESIFLTYQSDYDWFETTVVMKDFLDDGEGFTVDAVTSVFEVLTNKDDGYDTEVILSEYTQDGHTTTVKKGFWTEDFDLSNETVTLTFEKAYEAVMQSNFVKPHSRYCVLRKEIGPNIINPQYIFGNSRAQLYVDAVTGEVTDVDPAFAEPEETEETAEE